jgi:hypothetical protein
MDRTALIIGGALCWTAAALFAGAHLIAGDVITPAGMALSGVGYIAVRRAQIRLRLARRSA